MIKRLLPPYNAPQRRYTRVNSEPPRESGSSIVDQPAAQGDDGDDTFNETHESTSADDCSLLRKVPDSLPLSVWLVTAIEMCDKFAFFGMSGPLQNYIQNPRDDPLRPGAIGLGQAYATAINQGFTVWCYLTPILGAILADQYLGRPRTILYASTVYFAGLLILLSSSFPSLDYLVSLFGLITAMLFIGFGTGGIRPNVNSLVAEQYTATGDIVRTSKSGERVIVDRALTIQRIFMTFLLCVNMGSLSSIATTTVEHQFGFSAAFALPTLAFTFGIAVIYASRGRYVSAPPKGSVVLFAFQVLWIATRRNWNLEAAKPSYSSPEDGEAIPRVIQWDDAFVDEVRQTLAACKMFLFFPFFWAAYSQMLTNFVSQAATMETHGIPNDLFTVINPLAIIVFIPILDRGIFPWLRTKGFSFSPASRIVCGFMLCSSAMAYAALVQAAIYTSPPCYSFPRAQDCMQGMVPNQVHVFVQVPAYILLALSEILISFTGLEYASTQAPSSMKSFVMALFMSTYSIGSLLAMTISPFTYDPHFVWIYSILSLETLIVGAIFWSRFKNHDNEDI